MKIESGTDDVFIRWKRAFCQAGNKTMFESTADALRIGDFPLSNTDMAKELEKKDCVAPEEKKI